MNFRGLSLFALSFTTLIHAQLVDDLSSSTSILLREVFAGFDEVVAMNEEGGDQPFLRRGLQTSNVCRPTVPLNVPLQDGTFCNQLPNYPCTCTGSTETACTYCMIRPDANGIRCQVSGSSVTFRDDTDTVTTCGCEYMGNGQVQQSCRQASGTVPMPAPAVVVAPPPVPIAARVPVPAAVSVPAGQQQAGSTTSTGKKSKSSKKRK